MDKIILEKKYTRDNCFIIQEVWDRAYLEDFFGIKNPYFPPKINYLTEGIVEFWHYDKTIQWFIDKLVEKALQERTFIDEIIQEHLEILHQLRFYKDKQRLASIGDLVNLITLLEKGTRTFLAFWHLAGEENIPDVILKKARDARDEDSFYDDVDYVIRNSIENIYPHTKGLSIGILAKELNTPPEREILQQRFKNSVMVVDGFLEIGSLQDFVSANPKYELKIDQAENSEVLKGQVAFPGYAKGPARVIKLKSDVGKLEKGEILISPMTTPDFVPAMQKAAAVVTDEGGITCHAAIVSREMKKPCVVGTRHATEIFKTGDQLEVDAKTGVVRKVK